MNNMRDWKNFFRENAIYKELSKLNRRLDNSNDLIEISEILQELDEIKDYSVSLIKGVKDSDEFAFEELMKTKDIRNFIYYYAYAINKYHKFCYDEETVVYEIKYNIFNHIKTRYRIYNKPNELSLLIVSMRKWIRGRVSNSLKEHNFPKTDDNICNKTIEVIDNDSTELLVDELVEKCLNDEEKIIFDLRFYKSMGLVEIGNIIGMSKDSVRRKYKKALDKMKDEILGQGEQK